MFDRFLLSRVLCRGLAFLILCLGLASSGGAGVLEIKDGYFWDPQASNYFVPRGIAYQVWNPPVGASQSFEQLDYDLLEFKKMHANSVRCEMVWGELEVAKGVYDWRKPDHLVDEAERLGLRLFVLIGFQYPPAWFPKDWRGINAEGLTPGAMKRLADGEAATAFEVFPARARDALVKGVPEEFRDTVGSAMVEGAKTGSVSEVLRLLAERLPALIAEKVTRVLISDVINYEHPEARAAYARHLAAVAARYKGNPAIGGWILGNEYAYFDLWEDPALYGVHRFLGYDAFSQQAFRSHLAAQYRTNIAALNANWGTTLASFDSVEMPLEYPAGRDNPAYYDLIQWRKKSIGDFVAAGTAAARTADPRHLQTYSMVGGIFSGLDANNTCEDGKTIVARCRAAGAPLDFWSINNYAHAAIGSELRSGDFGIGKYQAESGLPVMISETGHSSTENLFDYPDSGRRQAKAVPSQLWESLISGAVGAHLFHWNDRNQYKENFFIRERGFGIVEQNRKPKGEVYTNAVNMFRRMHELNLDSLLGGSSNPRPDVQFFWSTNSDLVWPRANQENASLWGALKRLGYQPGIIDDAQFERRAYTNAPVLLLSRCFQMDPAHLSAIATQVLPAGVHVHANADLPGQYDRLGRLNPQWEARMNGIFGIGTQNAIRGLHAGVGDDFRDELRIQGGEPLAPAGSEFSALVKTWLIWHDVTATSGRTIATHTGWQASQPPTPALIFKDHPAGQGKAAVNTFAMADILAIGAKEGSWDFRYDWLRAIYSNYFNVKPAIQIAGRFGSQVIPDYRRLRNGSVLISLLNEGTNNTSLNLSAPGLLAGKTVENLTRGGIVEAASNGSLTMNIGGDAHVLLYAYDAGPGGAPSMHQNGRDRVWFDEAPAIVHPRSSGYAVELGFDVRGSGAELMLQMQSAGGVVFESAPKQVSGFGRETVLLFPPDTDAANPGYCSSPEGGVSQLRALLRSGTQVTAESKVPVRLAWPVRPVVPLPLNPVPGRDYSASLKWEELPSILPGDPTPFDRTRLWDRSNLAQAYAIVLQLADNTGRVVAEASHLTREGSGSAEFAISAPNGAPGPLHWVAEARPATGQISHDVRDGFEGHDRGAKWPDDLTTDFLSPWNSFTYAAPVPAGSGLWQNEGVQLGGAEGSQSAFLVVTNPPGVEVGAFGISHAFPGGPWALPEDRKQWTNWVFSFDFMEQNGRACVLEMQIKNTDPLGAGVWLQHSANYAPGPGKWVRFSATLDQFEAPRGMEGLFDPAKVGEIVLSVLMLEPSAQYVGIFDNIVFDGPDEVLSTGPALGYYSSANDYLDSLIITREGRDQVILYWQGTGSLETVEKLGGSWSVVDGAASGRSFPASETSRFYRLKR